MLEMRNILQKKLNKKGFTLAELLVVVAIIAVLVAVSIPVFAGKLENAKEKTDLANARAAKAAAVTEYLSMDAPKGFVMNYDAKNGVLTKTKLDGDGYGQSAKTVPSNCTGATKPSGNIIKVTVDDDGNVSMQWAANAAITG